MINDVSLPQTASMNGVQPATTGRDLLEIRHLSVDYLAGSGTVHALTDVSLTLQRGTILGLAGESGSGKSTLAYAVTRLLKYPAEITGGEVIYHPRSEDGTRNDTESARNDAEYSLRSRVFPRLSRAIPRSRPFVSSENGAGPQPIDILKLKPRQLRAFRWTELAIVFQSAMNALNPVLDVGTQIMDVFRAHRPGMTRQQQHSRAVELLRLVGIAPDRLHSFPHELSGGMRQRAIIAIALALRPELIIMDEPTTALDVVVQREILMEILALRHEFDFSAIFITQDLSLLLELADQVAIMYAGRVVETAKRGELKAQPRHPYSYGMLNSFPKIHGPRRRMTGIPGSPPDLRAIPSGCAFHPRCPLAFAPCDKRLPVLGPSTETTPDQLVACHLYDPTLAPGPLPTNADFAARYDAASLAEREKQVLP